jgi:hypothetical protein
MFLLVVSQISRREVALAHQVEGLPEAGFILLYFTESLARFNSLVKSLCLSGMKPRAPPRAGPLK